MLYRKDTCIIFRRNYYRAPEIRTNCFPNVGSRFRQRSRAILKHAAEMRPEALNQVDKGWLGAPLVLNDSGRLIDNPALAINLAFRLPVFQSGKVRAIEDLKHGLVNEYCVVDSPISKRTLRCRFSDCVALLGSSRWANFID